MTINQCVMICENAATGCFIRQFANESVFSKVVSGYVVLMGFIRHWLAGLAYFRRALRPGMLGGKYVERMQGGWLVEGVARENRHLPWAGTARSMQCV